MYKKLTLILAALLVAAALCSCAKNTHELIPYEPGAGSRSTENSTGISAKITEQSALVVDLPDADSSTPSAALPEEPGLILFDDFSDGYNKAYWTAALSHDNYSNELQFYYPDNVFAQDGCLKLRAIKEEFCGYDYTSGFISTKGKLAFKYADIEIRARHPIGKGLFASLWLAPAGEEDDLPEIDMMEVVGDVPENIWVVYHYRNSEENKSTIGNYMNISNPDDFHIYRLEWEENSISWFIDGELVNKTNRSPDISMHLAMNLAVGGDWPGEPSEFTVFPADFEIDYVKIVQNSPSGS